MSGQVIRFLGLEVGTAQAKRVERRLRLEADVKKILTIALLSIAAVASRPAQAAPSTQMHVSVEVIARTILTVDSQPSAVNVTPADIARGYLELPSAIAFRIRSNARNGYMVQFQPIAGPFTKAEVSWDNTVASVGSDSSWVTQPYERGTRAGSMNVRLTLAADTAPGTYAWPVSIAADSL